MESVNEDMLYVPQVTAASTPYVGQKFKSEEDASSVYNEYAGKAGFSVRNANCRKNNDGTEYVWRKYTCSKEGKTNQNYQEKVKNTKPRTGERNRGHTRCECKASMSIVKVKGEDEWAVSKFREQHNHPLATPKKVHLLRSHRKVSKSKKALHHQLSEANVPTYQQFRIMEVESGGPSAVGCLERDIRNYERKLRQELLGHDAESLLEYFKNEKERNENFYFAYDTEHGVFKRCFWADCESRNSYAYFGDVVVFDTTYNTNKYSMIFAPFIGVNHHRQTVVFGCGMLSDETGDSFRWLISQFIQAMPSHVVPGVIITDQDQAITLAVSEKFPTTLHRYCLWHIQNKFSKKLGPLLYNQHSDTLYHIINKSESPEEFEQRWGCLMNTTGLGRNDWLGNMYEIRNRWVPAYVRHKFSAGMSSSQRVEVNHAFFKRFVMKKNSLMDFMTRFRRAISHQRHEELHADHIDINEVPRTISTFNMEHKMARIYTKTIFLLFQREIKQSESYICSRVSSIDSLKTYTVVRYEDGKSFESQRHLTWNIASNIISCSCKLFEFDGYPCRHMLRLMLKKEMKKLPDSKAVD